MNRVLWTALVALPFFAQPANAQFFQTHQVPPMKLDTGITFNCSLFAGGGRTQLGPWYQYWPYEAHFQLPPPLGASMPGPSFMTLPPQFGHAPQAGQPSPYSQPQWTPPAPTPVPPATKGPTQRTVFQPVGYYYTSAAPSYWYGR
jgi:hypothetical protein